MLSGNIRSISHASNIVLLCFSIALVPAFVYWMHAQEKKERPALIPNSIWSKAAFTSTCIMVLIAYAVMNSMELFSSFLYSFPFPFPNPRAMH
jgi:hypothetical protein